MNNAPLRGLPHALGQPQHLLLQQQREQHAQQSQSQQGQQQQFSPPHPHAPPSAYAFAYNAADQYLQSQQGYAMCSPQTAAAAVAVGQQQHHPLVRMHQHYVQQSRNDLWQRQQEAAFLHLSQQQCMQMPQMGHPQFHHVQLKNESEGEPSSDESNLSDHAGVIRKVSAARVKELNLLHGGLTMIPPDLNLIQTNPPGTFNPSEEFTKVPGRLSLLSSAPKYRVTVGEIHRRINPPECLNASVLGGILRRAKSKDGGKELRDMLKAKGLVLPAGRRKTANVNSLTALVEVEADHLAKDFRSLCEHQFPARAVAEHLTRAHCSGESSEIQRRKNMLMATKATLNELSELLKNDRSPTGADNPPPAVTLDHSIQKHLTEFSLVTHGFGSQAILSSVIAVTNWLDESMKILEK